MRALVPSTFIPYLALRRTPCPFVLISSKGSFVQATDLYIVVSTHKYFALLFVVSTYRIVAAPTIIVRNDVGDGAPMEGLETNIVALLNRQGNIY